MSVAGKRIIKGARQALAFARGETAEGFVMHVPQRIDVQAIRKRLHLSQESFALRFGFTTASVRDWEQDRCQPERAARVLLRVIERSPEAVIDALKEPSRCDITQCQPKS